MSAAPKFPHVQVKLSGNDGNALAIIGRVTQALRRAGASADEIAEFTQQATNGDYNQVLIACMDWVEVI